MFKIIGSAFIIAASTLGGFYIAHSYSERPKQLRALQQALQMLETEIVYGAVPLYIAMEHTGRRLSNIVKIFFLAMSKNLRELDGESTFKCWDMAINNHFHETALKIQDKQILLQFGQTLGISDKEDQMKHIRLTIQSIQQEESIAREEKNKYEKLSKNLGILLGLLIVILMY